MNKAKVSPKEWPHRVAEDKKEKINQDR